MSHQVIFAWPHGGRSVSVAGSFSGWGLIPLTKQGNYFFTSLSLGDGVYHFKFVVDGVWQYDLGQPHEDDGSGNWNNYIELGVESEPVYSEEPVVEHKAPAHHHHHQSPAHAPSSTETEEEKPISKKQQKKQAKAQEKANKKEHGGGGGKKGKTEPAPEEVSTAPSEEPAPVEEEAAPVEEEAAPVEEEAAQPVEEEEAAPQVESKPVKAAESVVVIDVVPSDVDTDMSALEAFVRSITPEGLKWEGSSVSDYVFGLKKLTIICKCRDDVSVEEDVCKELEKNTDLVGSAQIQSFAC